MPALLNTGPLAWGPDDAQHLRDTLQTPFGRRLAFAFLDGAPPRTEASAERTLGRIEGYEHAVGVLNRLADVQLAVASAALGAPAEMYPDLDDPDKWPAHLGGRVGAPPVQIQTP